VGWKSLCIGLWLLVASVFMGTRFCSGNGFALYQGSARGNALEGAMVARADDPSALFYNPAGITQLPGLQVEAGATFIMPSVDIVTNARGSTTRTSIEDHVWTAPNAYASYQCLEALWVGFGLFPQFGLGTEFPENWPGRYNGYKGEVQSLTFNPNLAMKLGEHVSFAVGLDVVWLDLLLKQKIDASKQNNPNITTFDVDQSLQGGSYGYGYNLALHITPADWLALGISYRSQVNQDISGDARFIKPAVLAGLNLFNNTTVSGTIKLPDELFLGVMVKPVDRLSVEVGAILTRWHTFDALTIDFDSDPFLGSGRSITVTSRRDWHDSWRFMLGVEYKAMDLLDLRVSYLYDQTPDRAELFNYLTPINDLQAFSLGPGIHWKGFTLDLAYTYVMGFNRDIAERLQDGVLQSGLRNLREHLVSIDLAYKF